MRVSKVKCTQCNEIVSKSEAKQLEQLNGYYVCWDCVERERLTRVSTRRLKAEQMVYTRRVYTCAAIGDDDTAAFFIYQRTKRSLELDRRGDPNWLGGAK